MSLEAVSLKYMSLEYALTWNDLTNE